MIPSNYQVAIAFRRGRSCTTWILFCLPLQANGTVEYHHIRLLPSYDTYPLIYNKYHPVIKSLFHK